MFKPVRVYPGCSMGSACQDSCANEYTVLYDESSFDELTKMLHNMGIGYCTEDEKVGGE